VICGGESLYNGEMFWCVLYTKTIMGFSLLLLRHFLCVLLMNLPHAAERDIFLSSQFMRSFANLC
jgi:hypothetical protein